MQEIRFGRCGVPQISGVGGNPPTLRHWNLDNLGNWTGNANGHGLDGSYCIDHSVNMANEITSVGCVGGIASRFYIYDPAGNLASDSQFVFQYDAWNRLIQVNQVGTLPEGWNGKITDASQLGAFVCRYSYDGLGRLIAKETPVTASQTEFQRKDFYYDGVRRISEVIWREDWDPNRIAADGNDENPADDNSGGSNPPQNTLTYIWTDREYVYGPDYVDEFVCQYPYNSTAVMYMIQDANYDVVALCTGAGLVLDQCSYDPYGTVNAVDTFNTTHPVSRVGHQGLFFERYDGDYTQPSIAPNIAGLYQNRNRFYSPTLGRFITRDPNETGIPIVTATMMNGETIANSSVPFNALGLYLDGANLYQRLGSNPSNQRDPSGLFFGLIDLAGTSGFVANMNLETLDAGTSLLSATRGIIGQYNCQNLVLTDMLGSAGSLDSSEIDSALAAYQKFQVARNTALAAGLIVAGVQFAVEGYQNFARPVISGLVGRGFRSFDALKRFLGSPGPGRVWHHIVEQSQVSKFGAEMIHNTHNIISIPKAINQRLADYYNGHTDFSQGLRLRDWMRQNMSFEEQHAFGLQKLREFGGL